MLKVLHREANIFTSVFNFSLYSQDLDTIEDFTQVPVGVLTVTPEDR